MANDGTYGRGPYLSEGTDVISQILNNMNPIDRAAMVAQFLPVVGDAIGLGNDLRNMIQNPEDRTWTNAGFTALGALPFVPSGLGTIAGKSSKLADLGKLEEAKLMKHMGFDEDEIYEKTKWWLEHRDGVERFEFSNAGQRLRKEDIPERIRVGLGEKLDRKGSNFTKHYDLDDTTIIGDPTTRNSSVTTYQSGLKDINVGKKGSVDQMNDSLVHELQHIVQDIEGMGSGANWNTVGGKYNYLNTSGEVEARLAAMRSIFDQDFLDAHPFYKFYGADLGMGAFPLDKQIIRKKKFIPRRSVESISDMVYDSKVPDYNYFNGKVMPDGANSLDDLVKEPNALYLTPDADATDYYNGALWDEPNGFVSAYQFNPKNPLSLDNNTDLETLQEVVDELGLDIDVFHPEKGSKDIAKAVTKRIGEADGHEGAMLFDIANIDEVRKSLIDRGYDAITGTDFTGDFSSHNTMIPLNIEDVIDLTGKKLKKGK